MQQLYKLLENYTLEDALNLEKLDPQYQALEKLYKEIKDNKLFFWLIIANSLVCYQLSSTWEEYWEEFQNFTCNYLLNLESKDTYEFKWSQLTLFLKDFLLKSKWNKRLLNMKEKRLEKIKIFLDKFLDNFDFYLWNIIILQEELAKTMKQKKDAKTIVFAIKMILYWTKIAYNTKFNPNTLIPISIPIDSRLIQIFEKYKEDYTDIKQFYYDLSIKLKIPEIHLDAIIWVKFKELMKIK